MDRFGFNNPLLKGSQNRKPNFIGLESALYVRKLAQEAEAENDKFVINSLKIIRAFPNNQYLINKEINKIETRLLKRIIFNQFQKSIFGILPKQGVFKGNVFLGDVFGTQNVRFFLDHSQINQNLLVVGRAGSGKTTLLMNIASQLMNQGIHCWMIDFKQDYRQLLQYHPDLIVIKWKDIRLNPLEPIGDPASHLQTFLDIFRQCFKISSESMDLLTDCCEQLYRDFGVFNGSKSYPTLIDLHNLLLKKLKDKNTPTSTKDKARTCLNITNSIIKRMGKCVNVSSGFPLDKLLKRNIVWELNGLSQNLQSLFLKILLNKVFDYRIVKAERGSLRNVILFDEGKMVYGKGKENVGRSLGVDFMKQRTTQIRDFGVGLIIADQIPSTLSDFIKANVHTMICLHLTYGRDINEMKTAMGINDEQSLEIRRLKVGEAIVKTVEHPFCFKIRLPEPREMRHTKDDELECLMKPMLSALQCEAPQQEFKIEEAPEVMDKEPRITPKPLEEWRDFLIHIKKYADYNVSRLYDSFNISRRRGNKMKEELRNNGLIEEVTIRVPGESKRPSMYLKLTEKGEAYLNGNGR